MPWGGITQDPKESQEVGEGEMIPSQLDENAKQRQGEIRELQKLLF